MVENRFVLQSTHHLLAESLFEWNAAFPHDIPQIHFLSINLIFVEIQ